jgi:hypothetical protein
MTDYFDENAILGNADALLRDMMRPTSVGTKINVHIIPANIEPAPDFEAMRRLVAGSNKLDGTPTKDDESKK